MRIRSESKQAVQEHKAARANLERVSARDRTESDAYLAANRRVIETEQKVSVFRRG